MSDWIAIDWGTSNLRVWLVSESGEVRDHRLSDKGMGQLEPAGFEPALIALIDDWLSEGEVTQAVACGMVGARKGWIEAPYAAVPCKPEQTDGVQAPVTDPRLSVTILPGLSQITPSANVMRGEETQIAGYLAANPRFDGVICMPGTHTKWVNVSAGKVDSFQTCMTGELFALLSKQSVLRHSLSGDGWSDDAFDAALSECLTRPASFGARLFELRAADLLQGQAAADAKARLSGMLIGLELASAKAYWLGQQVVLIGDARLSALYQKGLGAQGLAATLADATAMTLAGLGAAYKYQTGGTE